MANYESEAKLEDEGINIRFRKQLSTDKVGAIVRNLLY